MKQSEATYLVLGSNLGNRAKNLQAGIRGLSNHLLVLKSSSIFESKPMAGMSQPNYFNQAIMVEENYEASDLLLLLKRIEVSLGRKPASKWAARVIDIDIIFKGQMVYSSDELSIPHPDYLNRDFVLAPISEIAPDFVPPMQEDIISKIQAECSCIIHKEIL